MIHTTKNGTQYVPFWSKAGRVHLINANDRRFARCSHFARYTGIDADVWPTLAQCRACFKDVPVVAAPREIAEHFSING